MATADAPQELLLGGARITVREIQNRKEWDALQPIWNGLLAASASATTFLTWEWLRAWWSAYGNDGDLRILIAVDETNVIRGIAPLRSERLSRYGQTFSTLAFIGDGSNDSDYLDFIVQRGFESVAIEAWLEHLRGDLSNGQILRLNEIPAESPNLRELKQRLGGQVWVERAIPCGTVDLPASWNGYLASLKPRFRTKIRSVLRRLEEHRDVRFAFCTNETDLDRLLPALFELHTRRWNHDGRPGVFNWREKQRFYGEVSRALLASGSLRFSWLEWNGRVLACQYGFVHGNSYLHLQEGYEPASEHWNIGIGLRAWSIREMLASGIREYDFLAGVGRHKTDWGARTKMSSGITVAAPTYKNLLFCRGPEWRHQLARAAMQLIPEKVLDARKARLERPIANQAPPPPPRDYIRRAAARVYFHSGGAAVSRIVRERFQASVTCDGPSLPRTWSRRRQPTGRILYYHRVNDENDPFFPSIPPLVFERQMRHIARRYRVVSLTAMLDHLASDSCENVVAVTFDDGYRDNYENAFPILQRYGIPATIFLTTGHLDSGEPLWFEVLAAAVKETSLECLDLEVDLPRRFWLRTSEERVAANSALFAMFRRMPEQERHEELPKVLSTLGARTAARPNTMLTWDQVRRMNQDAIDFGGHTVTHPYLSRLSRDQVIWEVSECKRRIECELQSAVSHFAYPNGRTEDFDESNKDILRNAGYAAAVTTVWGLNFPATDRLELRRGGAWERDEAMFAYKMDWYQLVNG